MSRTDSTSTVPRTWDEPTVCPFCRAELVDPGAGFMSHLDQSPMCDAEFEQWREVVNDDIGGEWMG